VDCVFVGSVVPGRVFVVRSSVQIRSLHEESKYSTPIAV